MDVIILEIVMILTFETAILRNLKYMGVFVFLMLIVYGS
jgi:hypothetical protein